MYPRRRTPDESGPGAFTLIELLVVIAIIAILAAILLPALGNAKSQTRATKCMSNQHQVGQAFNMYLDDFHEYPMYENYNHPLIDPVSRGLVYSMWESRLATYLPVAWTNAAIQCPGYSGPLMEYVPLGESSYAYNAGGTYNGWAGRDRPLPLLDLNLGLGELIPSLDAATHDYTPVPESQVVAPSDMFAMSDSRMSYVFYTPGAGMDFMVCGVLPGWPPYPLRHGPNYIVLFCDGHVTGMLPSSLFNPTNTAAEWNIDHLPHPEAWNNVHSW